MGAKEIVADVKVICRSCGESHQLKRGIDVPIYWCGDNLLELVVGDEVEYDETCLGMV